MALTGECGMKVELNVEFAFHIEYHYTTDP